MTTIKLRLNKTANTVDGKHKLVFQIIHDRKIKIFNTNFKMLISDFDPISERILPNGESNFSNREITYMHRVLNKQRREFWHKIEILSKQWGGYSVYDIANASAIGKKNFLLKTFDQQILLRANEGRLGMIAAFRSTRSSLSKFLKTKDIEISSINRQFVLDYISFLVTNKVSTNTIAFYLRNLKVIYNASMVNKDEQLNNRSPFDNIKMSPCKTSKRALSRDELVKLVNMEFNETEKHLEFARDFFLFSFYTRGMSLVDIVYLKKEDIKGNSIIYRRKKSKQLLSIAVVPQLQAIIDKYAHNGEYLLPILTEDTDISIYNTYKCSLSRINRNLKQIGERANLSIKLTSYVARHSWASLAKTLGVSVGVISEGLGHSSEQITRIYLKDLDKSVLDKVNEEVINLK